MSLSDLPFLSFETQQQFADWLAEQHSQSVGLWLKLAKKGTDILTVTYDGAVETALCYGWIDDQKRGFDEKFWLQKFTPRRSKNIWSKINREKSECKPQKSRKRGRNASVNLWKCWR